MHKQHLESEKLEDFEADSHGRSKFHILDDSREPKESNQLQ
jgi:hypothetical protein